jgi:GR25 family glycosyltransferase involved in LPS biosynthesis
MKIPVYIVNLKERTDRLKSILAEFKDKDEYNIRIKEAIKHENGGVGL